MKQVNKEGFSLVEMLIAMTITVFIMAGIITLLAYGTRSMSNTQARAALQDQAKEGVNHISTHVLEGTEVAWDKDKTRGGLLIGNKVKEINKDTGAWEERYEWCLYWLADGVEAGDPDLLCFIRLEDLVDETSALPSDFDTKDAEGRFGALAPKLQSLEAAKKQKGHLLCDNVKSFACKRQEKKDADGNTIGKASLHIELELKDDKSEFKSEKDIMMRNQ